MSEKAKYELTKNVITLLESMHWDPVFFCNFGYEDTSKTKIHAMIYKMKYMEETKLFHIIGRKLTAKNQISDDSPWDFISAVGISADLMGETLERCVESKILLDADPTFIDIFKELKGSFRESIQESESELIELSVVDGNIKETAVSNPLVDGIVKANGKIIGTFRKIDYTLSISSFVSPFTYSSDFPSIKVNMSSPKMLLIDQDYSPAIKKGTKLDNIDIIFTAAKGKKWKDKSLHLKGSGLVCKYLSPNSLFVSLEQKNIKEICIGPKSQFPIESIVDFPELGEVAEKKPQGRFANIVATTSATSFLTQEIERLGQEQVSKEVSSAKSKRFGRIVS